MTRRALTLLKRMRIASQAAFLCSFLYVFIRSLDPFSVVQNPFLRFDPLIFLTNPRFELLLLLPTALLLGISLAFGRVFCGWVCPMGSLVELGDFLLSFFRARNPFALPVAGPASLLVRFPPSLVILGATVVTVFTGPSLLPFFHPNVWVVRVFSLSALGLVFLGLVLVSSLFGRRLWCVYLCPLGALYGILSRAPFLRLRMDHCSRCGACACCPMQAADADRRAISAHQCTLCFDYEHSCRVKASFRFGLRATPPFDPRRRQLLLTGAALLGGAVAGVALGRREWTGGRQADPVPARPAATPVLRPPGVLDEDVFLRRCIRCQHCVQSCPNGIVESSASGGITDLFTPRLRFDRNGCDYRCQVCQLVCPNEAIPRQTLAQKQVTPIGLALLDQEKCVVTRDRKPCSVCEEVCPTPEKAIVFTKEERIQRAGGSALLKFPGVVSSRCIGCGICQANCPSDPVAITVARWPPRTADRV